MAGSKKHSKRKNIFVRRPYLMGSLAILIVASATLALYLTFGEEDAETRPPLRQQPVVSTERQVSVEVVDNDFIPNDLTVSAGATVTWQFVGDVPHNVVDDRSAFQSPTQEDGEWSRTFEEPGTFYYYCTLHHAMQGTLTVVP